MTCYPSKDVPGFICGSLPLTPYEPMTNDTDVIELVREFVQRLDNGGCSDSQWFWRTELKAGRRNQPDLTARQMAQALLIAVDALVEAREKKQNPFAVTQICNEALSRINSLPLQ